MTITKNLTHTLFITALIMLTMTNFSQLHGMEPKIDKDYYETVMNKDFQVYKLWSTLNNDHEWYLPAELVQIITINISKLIDKECYEKYNTYLDNPKSLIKCIENKCNEPMNDICIANTIQRCLRYSDKSLNEIKDHFEVTAFHYVIHIETPDHSLVRRAKILNLIAGNEAWNMICIKDVFNKTALHKVLEIAIIDHSLVLKELLSATPSPEEAWNLIITPDAYGNIVLNSAKKYRLTETIKLFESYRPKEQ